MKEIKIDVKKLLKAPIDDKNVMSDWLTDTLFDDQEYTFDKNEYLGFVAGYPTFMSYSGNEVEIRYLHLPKSTDDITVWKGAIMERITGSAYEGLWCVGLDGTLQLLDETNSSSPEDQHVITFSCKDEVVVTIAFHWNVPK